MIFKGGMVVCDKGASLSILEVLEKLDFQLKHSYDLQRNVQQQKNYPLSSSSIKTKACGILSVKVKQVEF